MTLLKNLFAAVVLLLSVVMISCQSGAEEARDEARESLTQTEGAAAASQVSSTPAAQPSSVAAESDAPVGPTTVMKFEHMDYEFGTVKEGEKVSHTYKFTNTGDEPLIISSAKGSCGCTVPKWPSEPIAPGATGVIDVVFDSKGKPGKQAKRVTVNANTVPAQTFLNISGTVEKAADAPN